MELDNKVICPFCKSEIKPGEPTIACPVCHELHHVDCWEANNNKCAAPQCNGEPQPNAPVETAPIETAPVETAPVEAAPVEAAPVEAAPVETAPVETAPVETAPIETAPIETAPIETAPVETAPVEAAPVEATQSYAPPVNDAQSYAPVQEAPVQNNMNGPIPPVQPNMNGPVPPMQPNMNGPVPPMQPNMNGPVPPMQPNMNGPVPPMQPNMNGPVPPMPPMGGAPYGEQPKKKKTGAIIGGIIGGLVGLILIICIVASIISANSINFNKTFGYISSEPWCTISSDGKTMYIDSNPYNVDDDYFTSTEWGYFSDSTDQIKVINSELGFSSSLYEDDMLHTSANDGLQTRSNDDYKVSWTYHPDRGIEVKYEVK